ncbi:sodium:proton antiporter [Acidaminobacter sp. JC074]|uniref:Na+/H+ antiporter NhaC family protein n=1 Tax=Acidaminobacter sp. JC074 TaxID=2530199 RepID=UPI001F0DD385|nr:Na+/H+ antiporter NhaC family protein [Acidaminobacter sp. JC074]MCH4886917.1 sodium:proton antiporter [Acidaminobacter sp. JC074]
MERKYTDVKYIHKLIPVIFFMVMIIYGFGVRPVVFDQPGISIEVMMVILTTFTSMYLMIFAKVKWEDIEEAMKQRIGSAVPTLAILLAIGILIAALIMAGTLPMLIYYGVKMINPSFIYAIAFILPIVFSLCTGTSWGSAATIGVVLMSIATTIDANLAITAGAVVSGSYFGDKLSPISDTTNLAALAAEVDLYDHVKSMLWTTVPTAVIALTVYIVAGFMYPPAITSIDSPAITSTLTSLKSMFSFNPLLLLPIAVVVYGSYRKKSAVTTMMGAALSGYLLAIIFQPFSLNALFESLGTGFKVNMIDWYVVDEQAMSVVKFIERGGFWSLGRLVPKIITTLMFVSAIGTVDAITEVVTRLFSFAKSRFMIITSTLWTAAIILGVASNGIACTFVTADIFKKKYDENNIPRKVLSRSIEDAGTMLNPLYGWTPAGIFFASTLGVPISKFAPWAVMNYGTIIVAMVIAYLGIGVSAKEDKGLKKAS